MKKENLVILVAFIVCVFVFLTSLSRKSQEEPENSYQKSKKQEIYSSRRSEASVTIQRLEQENKRLRARIQELENEKNNYKQPFANDTFSNPFETNVTEEQNDFGVYQSYTPLIKELIDFAKGHEIPVKHREDLKELINLCNTTQQVKGTINYSNMNMITFRDGTYIKLLQNLVAIYSPKVAYHIDFTLEGQATCVGKMASGYQACQSLGGTDETPNDSIPSWLTYKLPKNLYD